MEDSFRSADMKKLGTAIGWDFQKKANLEVLKSDAQQLKLGEYIDYHPLLGETHNLLTGKIYDIDGYIEYGSISDEVRKNFDGKIKSYDAMVFDQKIYHDVLEHGYKLESLTKGNVDRMESKNQTIFLIKLDGVSFPPFCIEPEGFWSKVRGLIEKHDFDFPDFPVFSHKYQLYGDIWNLDLEKIFNENVLRFYEKQNPSFVTIGNEDRLLVYTPDQLLDPKDFDKEMKFSIKLAKCFLQTEK